MASKKETSTTDSRSLPFGAIEPVPESSVSSPERSTRAGGGDGAETKPRGPRRRGRRPKSSPPSSPQSSKDTAGEPLDERPSPAGDERPRSEASAEARSDGDGASATATEGPPRSRRRRRWQERRRGRRGRKQRQGEPGGPGGSGGSGGNGRAAETAAPRLQEVEGMLLIEKGHHGSLRLLENSLLSQRDDVHVPPHLVQKLGLRDGSMIKGLYGRGKGRYKRDLVEVETVDGKQPDEVRDLTAFKLLTSIDPDFHYAGGDGLDDVSLRIIDLICPIGRGQRGLIVAPPRSGKTILLRKFAKALEQLYPDVHLIVLLIDERPEEATEWQRSVEHGQVFVSNNDEMARTHVDLCEAVWRRCRRLVELGEDVVLLLDSLTRMGRAYNNIHGNSGKTMSGGLDSRALERPKQFFGSARNTETAGSLTILATALIETGSQMDKIIFEEFKGTGNMELVLSRKLADRRIFPAIDLEKSGTRKEEKLISSQRLKLITTLRRVLMRMHFAEAMELLISKLEDVQKTDDFLQRFEIDPEAE
ncbi:MAG: transcription termination factor Rho [Planctomycetota bacterium]|nr:transcription termination factor Rho [Planctomycetota bacterium]